MDEKSEYDVMCLERGDIEYIQHAAQMLMSAEAKSEKEIENIALALKGIARASYALEDLTLQG